MNFKMIRYIMGQLLIVECGLMSIPLITSIIYGETKTMWAFIIPMILLAAIGSLMVIKKPKNTTLGAKEGFIVVGISWMIMSLFGCLPFMISNLIPNFFKAYFETVSGFTTTGSSILGSAHFYRLWNPVSAEVGLRGVFLWRSFTHWVGGMGVLVFVLAFMPQHDLKSSRLVYIMKAEMPGPKVDKIVSTIKKTARIMYSIYLVMTAVQVVLLLFGGMDFYEALCVSFGTAGTGGFSIWADGMQTMGGANYNYCVWVITIFMLLFSVNFNLYFLIITGKILTALMSEELRWFVGIVITSVAGITISIYGANIYADFSVGDAIRESAFQVATVISTTGFATCDFNLWPNVSKVILLMLMFVGACAGSTGGGMKVSRIIITLKSTWTNMRRMIKPREIKAVRFESKPVDEDTKNSVSAYFVVYAFVFFASFLLITIFDGVDIETGFSSVAATLNNIGPAFGEAGPTANFNFYSIPSLIVLTFNMLLGRLEIFPILFLFSPATWRNK